MQKRGGHLSIHDYAANVACFRLLNIYLLFVNVSSGEPDQDGEVKIRFTWPPESGPEGLYVVDARSGMDPRGGNCFKSATFNDRSQLPSLGLQLQQVD